MNILVDYHEGRIVVAFEVSGDERTPVIKLSPRNAFALVTELLVAIDGARAFLQAERGEVPNPDGKCYECRRKNGFGHKMDCSRGRR